MDTKREFSYWWWFDSHNSSNCSPWLESTLAELNEKTKVMLKLIDEDADSFRQRAEMYYKKRPELISMVEDFYRAHRSLAERYDQLRIDPSGRVRSPMQSSVWNSPKKFSEKVISSVKSYDSDSFAEEVYNSEESAESEIDDPELDQDGSDRENSFSDGSTIDVLINLREELDRLQEENEIQRDQIELKDRELEKLMARLYGNLNELKNLREEMETTRKLKEHSNELMMPKYEIERKEAKCELMKLREEMDRENMQLRNGLVQKDEEKREVIRQLSIAMEILREENQFLKKSIKTDALQNSTKTKAVRNPKLWNSPEIQIFKGVEFGKMFDFWSKYQTSVVPL